jgi:hypothetical protein
VSGKKSKQFETSQNLKSLRIPAVAKGVRRNTPHPLDPTLRAADHGICVVVCVVTLASLPVSKEFGRCRSGTGKGQGRCVGPA